MSVKAETSARAQARSERKAAATPATKRPLRTKAKGALRKKALGQPVGASPRALHYSVALPRGDRGAVARLAIQGVIGLVAAVPETEATRLLASAERAAVPEERIMAWLRVEDTDRKDDALEAAFRRGDERKAALLREPTMLTGEAAAARLGVSRETINKRAQQGKLLALEFAKRGKRYPDWQFEDRLAGSPIERVMTALTPLEPWERYRFFTQKQPGTGGQTPIEALRQGALDAVCRAAEAWTEGGQGGG